MDSLSWILKSEEEGGVGSRHYHPGNIWKLSWKG